MADNLVLDKVITVDGKNYEVTAVEADKVKNSLKLKRSLFEAGSYVEKSFDGTSEQEFDYVSASKGGRFNNKICVPNNTEPTIDNEETVLNYHDIKNVLLRELTKTSVIYAWNGEKLDASISADSVNSLSLIKGIDEAASDFAAYNYNEKLLTGFIYLGIDTGNIYFGSSDLETLIRLATETTNAVNADNAEKAELAIKATQLETAHTIRTNLSSATSASFNGTADIEPGITGILPIANGGTGQDSLDKVTVKKAKQLDVSRTIKIDLGSTSTASFNGTADVEPGVKGTLPVANGGTGQTSLTNVTTGKSNATKVMYGSTTKYPKITISTTEPSSPAVGDIWIKY